jgi:asparagine synthase (glutamine-hydrolysing)
MFHGRWDCSRDSCEPSRLSVAVSSAGPVMAYSIRSGGFSATAESPAFLLIGELRLDNGAELAAALGTDGQTPSQLVLGALEHFGVAAFDRIVGEFALLLFDRVDGSILLARDALARRPLFVAHDGRTLLFGSEAVAVASEAGPLRADLTEIASFLMQRGQSGDRSFLAGVSRIEPGSWMRVDRTGRTEKGVWWTPDTTPTPLADDALVEALQDSLDRSVAAIRARHPAIAAHLSAGLDSSLAVATASRQLLPRERLHALCISPAHEVDSQERHIGDEYPIAAETARMLGNVDLKRVVAADDDWIAQGDRFAAAAGTPYRNVANLGWFAASYRAAAATGATGLIESTDGNATFSWVGNGAVPTLIRQRRLTKLARVVRDERRFAGGSGALIIPWGLWNLLPPSIADPLAGLAGKPSAAQQAYLRPRHPAVRTVEREIRSRGHWSRMVRPARDALDRLTFLRWSDRAPHLLAMENMFGIELCDPFSWKPLVELTMRIEEPRFRENGFGRRFARRLLEGRVPKIVSDGRIDWLQSIDWRVGALAARPALIADLAYAAARDDLAALFDLPRLRSEVEGWRMGREDGDSLDRAAAVLRAIVSIRFVRWLEQGAARP